MDHRETDNENTQLKESEHYRAVAEEYRDNMKSTWKIFLKTGVFLLSAIIVLIILGIAWFVMNNWVNGESAAISALYEKRCSIATLKNDGTKQGVYDSNETNTSALANALNKYFSSNGNGSAGNQLDSFSGLPNLITGTHTFEYEGKTYVLGDEDGISLQVTSDNNVNNTREYEYIGPGSRGKITFYIIPNIENLNQVNISVSLKAFALEKKVNTGENTTIGEASPIELPQETESVLANMLKGHIMLFAGMENGNYSNRIIPEIDAEGRLSFSFDKRSGDTPETKWNKEQPVPVTVYWIWPKRFENIKYCGQEDSVFESECDEHSNLLRWIRDNKKYIVNTNEMAIGGLQDPTGDMTNAGFSQWSKGYNKGDQLIGEKVAFFQWEIEAN